MVVESRLIGFGMMGRGMVGEKNIGILPQRPPRDILWALRIARNSLFRLGHRKRLENGLGPGERGGLLHRIRIVGDHDALEIGESLRCRRMQWRDGSDEREDECEEMFHVSRECCTAWDTSDP